MNSIFLYIDPGSGSYIIQLIIAGILGSLFFFKNAWVRVKHFFGGRKNSEQEKQDNEL
ncbi:MAG: hypothetical protein WKF88_10875 [Ferruginibacter sp.]